MSWLSNTYNETVDFWSRSDSFDRAIDTLSWATTKEGSKALVKELDTSITDTADSIGESVSSGFDYARNTAIKVVAVVAGGSLLYIYLKNKVGKYGRE